MAMTQAQSVLDLNHEVEEIVGGDEVYFAQPEEDGAPSTAVFFPRWKFEDMGSPQQITVTIVPGDQLNTEPTVEIGGQVMTQGQFDAARFPLLNPATATIEEN